jgi:MtfA peptidase
VNGTELRLALIAAGLIFVLVCIWAINRIRSRRRQAAISEPFPAEWRALLEQQLPLYRRLPPDLRARLEPLVRGFLSDVTFRGCNGLEVTDEMRLIVAVQACLLVSQYDVTAYGDLRSVLLYPDEFVVNDVDMDEAGVITEGETVLSGQSIETHTIVLSWPDVLASKADAEAEAYNVVLHEFAHHLDETAGGALTAFGSGHRSLAEWHAVLQSEYEALSEAVERGEETLIDPYGAEEPVEFFAVATETFFELPHDMERHHPRLYAELRDFYGLDPARW